MDDVRKPDVAEATGHLTAEDRRWMDENREAIQSFNEWYERNGSPLDKHRVV